MRERVLIVGAYLADRPNRAEEIVVEFNRSEAWQVTQVWQPLFDGDRAPKFTVVNRLLARDLEPFRYVVVSDDDIDLPLGFLDDYLALVERHDFALAQPARTRESHYHHAIVRQAPGVVARETRFVEIGPLFSMRADAARILTPFDEISPMGWGYDLSWPIDIRFAGLRMGIVDATPIAHVMRPPLSEYRDDAGAQMAEYLRRHAHVSRDEAYTVVEAYA